MPIEGLSINRHIDHRNKEVGYMCLTVMNISQKKTNDLDLPTADSHLLKTSSSSSSSSSG